MVDDLEAELLTERVKLMKEKLAILEIMRDSYYP
jgi:hypothetical protein